eukprot:3990369-Prymnesium_polylepis.1
MRTWAAVGTCSGREMRTGGSSHDDASVPIAVAVVVDAAFLVSSGTSLRREHTRRRISAWQDVRACPPGREAWQEGA